MTIGNVQILDLSSLVSIVTGWGVLPVVLMWMRKAFLDKWLGGLSSDQQNQLLRGVLLLLTALCVLAVALATGHPFTWRTILSVMVSTLLSAGLAHLTFNYVQKPQKPAVLLTTTLGTTTPAPDASSDPFAPLNLPPMPDVSDPAAPDQAA